MFFCISNRVLQSALLGMLAMSLAACGHGAGNAFNSDKFTPTPVVPINHTTAGLNWMKVNGGAGTGCCVMLPNQWRPGLKATIEWETDPAPREKVKKVPSGGAFDEDAWKAHEAKFGSHKAVVDIPQYPDNTTCKLQVHLLTCSRVKVTTTCLRYDDPDYPIQEPEDVPEPKSCSGVKP
ncbi:DUF3304 domain-containing protein [Amantichitinum ursilacus]|uniref:DUF3304 domain-containing protein n=1 Tax=Amantichitinum ursilacus TaxID=857265 RepID=A0A0N0GPH8_9NEIS|nr:DUF3304 domain-containing protein [Amantichitinum ursilacus]KPC53780.1 hypothetical protein WG78_08050 [Amantichitinum ursilacus]